MKQLTVFEMESISGGAFDISSVAETAAAAVLGAVTFGLSGTILGGRYAGSNGGILGFGILGNAVGFVWGVLAGGVGGAVVGAIMGFDRMSEMTNQWLDGIISGTTKFWA